MLTFAEQIGDIGNTVRNPGQDKGAVQEHKINSNKIKQPTRKISWT